MPLNPNPARRCRRAALLVVVAGAAATAACQGSGGTDPPPPVREALEACGGMEGEAATECYIERVERRVEEGGTEAALETLSGLAERVPGINADGHRFVHAVGMAAYREERDVHDAFESCTDLFQSGCRHGTLQAHFMALDSVRAADVRRVCAPYREPGRELLAFQCQHGVGHGLTMYYGWDLPRALEGCDALEGREARHSCYGGAFMENAVHATRPHRHGSGGHGAGSPSGWRAMEPDDPHHPCSAVEARYRAACYEMQTSIMIHLNDGSLKETVEECERAPEGWRDDCFRSLGRSISIRAFDDLDRAARLCRVGDEELRPHCFQGLAHTLMFLGTRPFPEVGFELCRKVPAAERAGRLRCYFAVGRALEPRLDRAERRSWCGRAPRRVDRTACRIGSGLGGGSIEALLER